MQPRETLTVPALQLPLVTAARMRAHIHLFVRVLQTMDGFRHVFLPSFVAETPAIVDEPDTAVLCRQAEEHIQEMLGMLPSGLAHAALQRTQFRLTVQNGTCPSIDALRQSILTSVLDLHFASIDSVQTSFDFACHVAVAGITPHEQGVYLTKLIVATIHRVGRQNLHRLATDSWLAALSQTAFEVPSENWTIPPHCLAEASSESSAQTWASRQALEALRERFAPQSADVADSGEVSV